MNQSFLVAEGAQTEEARAGLAAEAGTARVAGVGRAHRPLAEVSGEAGRAVAVPVAVFCIFKDVSNPVLSNTKRQNELRSRFCWLFFCEFP